MSSKNYTNCPVASRQLANRIKEYYQKHPSYTESFCEKIETTVFFDERANVWSVRSNIADLMSNVNDLEARYATH